LSGNVWGAQAATLSFSAVAEKLWKTFLQEIPRRLERASSVSCRRLQAGSLGFQDSVASPKGTRLSRIRGSDLAEKDEKKVLTVFGAPG
jgi:hypothetical protein